MNVVAVLAVRNGEAYIANALRHFIENGVNFVVIDNELNDGTIDIVRQSRFAEHLLDLRTIPFEGSFDLGRQLEAKMDIIARLDAEWVIHADVDEIMHPRVEGESLRDAIVRIDAADFNVLNFDEFVFLPIDGDYRVDAPGFQPLRHYYFFQPSNPRLMRAWKRSAGLSPVAGAGHIVEGDGVRLASEFFVLRHYMFLDQQHALAKYPSRRFSHADLSRHWHGNRIDQPVERFRFPPPGSLKRLERCDERALDRSSPHLTHYWQW